MPAVSVFNPRDKSPGVYLFELPSGTHTITGVSTSVSAFVGRAPAGTGPVKEPTVVTSFADFETAFGGLALDYPLTYAVRNFFLNGGSLAVIVCLSKSGSAAANLKEKDFTDGVNLLDTIEAYNINILCIPPDTRGGDVIPAVWPAAAKYCSDHRAFLIVDPPTKWTASPSAIRKLLTDPATALTNDLGVTGPIAGYAAVYFPRVRIDDPLAGGRTETFVACGVLAGLFARTDAQRGVWKAPAGLEATLKNVRSLELNLTDAENGRLNPVGINCLRNFPEAGRVSWGARTLRGNDDLSDDYKYVPVRRLALYIEESLYRGTKFAVFQGNDEPLWAQIRQTVEAFMQDLFRKGAFQGASPREAYLVKCDKETTTQTDIDKGVVNVVVGFAPLKPAEFVFVKFQQLAGQAQA